MAASSMWSSQGKQQYELPRWRQTSMAASIIPPPIVSPTNRRSPPPSALPYRSIVLEKPQAAESRESELQADLQYLLDAQAEGLLRGVDADDRSSTGSATPTTRSVRSDVNRPVRRKLGLRNARKGIYSCIVALASIKTEELETAEQALRGKEHDLEQIQAWEAKKHGLQDAASRFDNTEESVRVQRLKSEADIVQEDIVRAEAHVSELKARHRQLLQQATAVENSVQAKLATYTTSLSILESDIKRFLSSRPREPSRESKDAHKSVWQLPPQRRTLDLAREQITTEQQDLQSQQAANSREKDALDQGADIWKEVASKVTEFEKSLRAEMARLGAAMTESTQAWDDTAREDRSVQMRELYGQLKALIKSLETHVHAAEEQGWTLLIAAIGAELDALRRGEEILAGVVGQVAENDTAEARQGGDASNASHDTDEEPDPDLLFSVQDGDDDD